MTDRSSALRAKTSYAAKYGVEFFERKTVASYALWSITLKDPETGRYPRLPTAYGRTDTLEQAHLELTDWCEARGLSFSDIRNDLTPWRLVKDLLEGQNLPKDEFSRRNFEPRDDVDEREKLQALALVVDPIHIGPVEIHRQKPFITSLELAARCGVGHQTIIRQVRRHLSEFEELGFLGFQIRENRGTQGAPTEIAILNEDQATYAITLTRNTAKVRRFKLELVKAFRRALDEIARLYANPPRKDLIAAKRSANAPMLEALIEHRAEAGKATAAHHFANEAKLCNFVVTGQFKPLDERALTNEQAELLAIVRRRNESLLMAGLAYEERKRRLSAYATKTRTARLSPPDRSGIKPSGEGLVPIGAIAAKRATEGENSSGEPFIPAPGNEERAA